MPILTICKHKMQVFQQGSWDQRLKLCCKFCSSTNSLGQDNPRSKQQAKQLTNETRNIQHIGHIILQAGAGAAKRATRLCRATRPSIYIMADNPTNGKNLYHPLNYGVGLHNPPNYEIVYITPWTFQNRSNYPLNQFWKIIVNYRKIIK